MNRDYMLIPLTQVAQLPPWPDGAAHLSQNFA
jgi:hypothetical protein